MNSKHARTIELVPLVNPKPDAPDSTGYFGPTEHFLEVEVYYNAGGMNMFSGSSKARGYYMRSTPITRQITNHSNGTKGVMQGFMLFSGSSILLEEAKRFSATSLDRLAGVARLHPRYSELKDAVIAKHNLTVKPDGPAFERRPAEYPA
jgi:hypothetical protein